jgi:hypothetical protein
MMRDPVFGVEFERSANTLRVQGVAMPLLKASIDSAATEN